MSDENKKFIEALQKRSENKMQIVPDSYFSPNYDPHMQLGGIRQFINCLRMESAGNYSTIEVSKHTGRYESYRGGDAWADDCAEAIYFDATISGAIVASLAQYIEGLFTYEFNRISKNSPQLLQVDSRRYQVISIWVKRDLEQKKLKKQDKKPSAHVNISKVNIEKTTAKYFWDPHWYIQKDEKQKGNIANGIVELCKLFKLDRYLPEDFELLLTAIFQYRNYVMHNGVEWDSDKIRKFKQVDDGLAFDAFEWSKRNGEEYIAFISDELVNKAIQFCDACLEHVWFSTLD
ncbi:hypothetical protein [Alteromonas macleodii]|uniref:Uncharacterized protein n=1 Tax=Alteromonas macleodii TaxID=28108 RepID=A0A6T9Y3F0_ALTMA|nr:hypothetical protein [Alteromonas macleodii]CAB9495352.1 conserved protein of unknown function [Alteromonas macleodii]